MSPAGGARTALLVVNPKAGGGRGLALAPGLRAPFLAAGWQIETAVPSHPAEATRAARDAARRGLSAVLVLGGDGSVRAVATGLRGSPTALGPLPGGTTNVVARALGLPADPLTAAVRLADGRRRTFDLGLCGPECFLMQASLGLDAAVIAGLSPALKRRLGKLGVALSGLLTWSRYRFPELALSADGEDLTARGVVVANLAEYAGAFRIAPAADPADGRLDLLLWRGRSRRAALGFALALVAGRHTRRTDVELRRVDEVILRGPAGAPLQLDGDPYRLQPPARVALAAERLAVLAPA